MNNLSSWSLPRTATEVVDLQSSFLNLRKGDNKADEFIRDTKDRLDALIESVKAEEDKFFKLFEKADSLEKLQEKLDIANSDVGFRAMTNLKDSQFNNLVYGAFQKVDYSKPFTITLNNTEDIKELGEFGERILEDGSNFLIDALNKQLTEGARHIRKFSSGNKGLGKYVTKVTIKRVEGEISDSFQVEVEAPDLSPEWRYRLKKQFDATYQSLDISTAEILKDWLLSNISNNDLRECVEYQFDHNLNRYDLKENIPSIKGFLGEVHAAAFFDYILGKKGAVVPTGAMKDATTGQEIPIDLVIEGFGLQIKNYRLYKDKVTFLRREENSMQMGNFIEQRLNPEDSIENIMKEFFASYQFNQPVPDASDRYKQIYKRFSMEDRIKGVFDGYIDNLMKISSKFNVAGDTLWGTKDLYFNTIFMISDKLVPASKILESIRAELDKITDNAIIKTKYYISTPIADTDVWSMERHGAPSPLKNYLEKLKVHWVINLDLSRILERAINQ